jgi:calcineurin-like phosphoesterase family protein
MGNTYFISDTHFNHTNIIKYCNRPYSNTIEMNNDIIKKWNSVVSKRDIVYHLGDFAFFKKSQKNEYDYISDIIKKLNGKIILILGNHDISISRNIQFWMDLGFWKVYDVPILYNRYILSHRPLIALPIPFDGLDFINIHGHTHNSNADFYSMSDEDKKHWNSSEDKYRTIPDITRISFNVSLEVIGYKPISLEELENKWANI